MDKKKSKAWWRVNARERGIEWARKRNGSREVRGRSLAFSQDLRTLHLIDLYRVAPIPPEHSRSSFLHPTIPYHYYYYFILPYTLFFSTSLLYLSVIFLFLCFLQNKKQQTRAHTVSFYSVFCEESISPTSIIVLVEKRCHQSDTTDKAFQGRRHQQQEAELVNFLHFFQPLCAVSGNYLK